MRGFVFGVLAVVLFYGCLDDEITSEALSEGDLGLCLAHDCEKKVMKSTTSTTIPYENKSILGKATEKASDVAAGFISDIIGF